MSKIITSPINDFPGTITLAEVVTLPMLTRYEEAKSLNGTRSVLADAEYRFASIVSMCERWDISCQPEKPATYNDLSIKNADGVMCAGSFRKLILWLIYEIDTYIGTETTVPKFLLPALTATLKTPPTTTPPQ
jgi:hypothetical protein